MIELLDRGMLETDNVATLGIYAGHNMLDRTILASGIHGLQDDQDRPAIGGVKAILGFC